MGTYTNVTNRESPYSWAYRLSELSDNSFVPGNVAVYKRAMQEGHPQIRGMPFSYPGLDPRSDRARFSTDSRLNKAAVALSDLYGVHQPLLRAPIPKDYFQKATRFLQNFEDSVMYPEASLGNTVQDLGFTGEDQLQDIADLAEILRILDQFGEGNIQNQVREATESPGILSALPLSDKDRLRWADLYKKVSPALRQPNRDYSVFKPYLTPTGYKNLMNTVGQAYKDRASNWVKQAMPTQSTPSVKNAMQSISQSDNPNPNLDNSFDASNVVKNFYDSYREEVQ